jgi:hypothetical protein
MMALPLTPLRGMPVLGFTNYDGALTAAIKRLSDLGVLPSTVDI